MRSLFRLLDAVLHLISGNYAFCEDARCLFRLRQTRAQHTVELQGATIRRGEPVLELHLWNRHVPPMPPEGANLAWALAVRRMLGHSLQLVAVEVLRDPALTRIRAVRGDSVMVNLNAGSGSSHLMERLGFTVRPYQSPLGRFSEFWKNLHAWMLMWAYNPVSLRGRGPLELRRSEVWMTTADFVQRYSPLGLGQQPAPDAPAVGTEQNRTAASRPSQARSGLS